MLSQQWFWDASEWAGIDVAGSWSYSQKRLLSSSQCSLTEVGCRFVNSINAARPGSCIILLSYLSTATSCKLCGIGHYNGSGTYCREQDFAYGSRLSCWAYRTLPIGPCVQTPVFVTSHEPLRKLVHRESESDLCAQILALALRKHCMFLHPFGLQ